MKRFKRLWSKASINNRNRGLGITRAVRAQAPNSLAGYIKQWIQAPHLSKYNERQSSLSFSCLRRAVFTFIDPYFFFNVYPAVMGGPPSSGIKWLDDDKWIRREITFDEPIPSRWRIVRKIHDARFCTLNGR